MSRLDDILNNMTQGVTNDYFKLKIKKLMYDIYLESVTGTDLAATTVKFSDKMRDL